MMTWLPQNDATMSWLRGEAQRGNISACSAERLIGASLDPYLYDFVKRKGMTLSDAVKKLDDVDRQRSSPNQRQVVQRVVDAVKQHVQKAAAARQRPAAPRRAAPSSSVELVTTPRPADAGNWDRAAAKVNAEFKVASPR
ncbi:hypothetical protein GPL21_39150 [Bradyrhizobium pachyrhizi]|uniref:Uncharacterized protein n=1 Tax=Bradyrhizobium pachyrhizi TaxID=280333 RepID=A0A844T6A5_9BRAD|nr:hypothetical protein [Bradyrhizobium pachyrhizi]MVT71062.1 hypothetical protein [Bradyrhizobium pachyrhizi]